jgi:hypothetical protein
MLGVRLWTPTRELNVRSFDFVGKCGVTDTIQGKVKVKLSLCLIN